MFAPPSPSDPGLPAEAGSRAVLDAANAMEMREIDFFRLAASRWPGAEADDLEKLFAAYMFQGAVPPWVRHLAREVLSRRDAGTLDRRALGAERYRRRIPLPRHGKRYVALTAAIWAVLFVMLLGARYDPGDVSPMECPGVTGAKFFEDWVYTIAGKEPPPCDGYRNVR